MNVVTILVTLKKIKKNIVFIDTHNNLVIQTETDKRYEVEGKVLDSQQIEAVVACEDASLVIAAAGSGKTLSLVAKFKYLVEEVGIPSEKILLISFTNNATNEIKRRVKRLGFKTENIKTFHSLGNRILHDASVKKKKLVKDNQIKKIIRDIIERLLIEDEFFAKNYNDYLLNYHTTPVDPSALTNLEEIINFNKSYLKKTLKQISLDKNLYDKEKPTIKGEYIKSKEEQIIANFLYINQIPYEYEKQYPFVQTKYTPDFTIDEFNEPVYLEHFGINRENETHPSIDSLKYISDMNWKRRIHRENNTFLLESYSYLWQEGTLLTHIERELNKVGKVLNRMKESEIFELVKKSYKEDYHSFEELLFRFLALFKNSPYSLEDLDNKINGLENSYQKLRIKKFTELFEPIFLEYSEKLRGDDLIDFADMIKESTKIVDDYPIKTWEYDYILVDEAQDLSYGKFSLLKALLDKNPGARLFCVGDDWQSIYRFAGSDMSLMKDFEQYFERKTYFCKIEKTYRFGEPTVEKSGSFITKNPNQIKKNVISNRKLPTTINVQLTKNNTSEADLVENILRECIVRYSIPEFKNKKILVLSRYNREIEIFEKHKSFEVKDGDTNKIAKIKWITDIIPEGFEFQFCSIHKAKGLTKDIIILVNCNDGVMGIPATQEDDPILEILLSHPDNYPYSEERRLFYVAITRAKEETYLTARKDNPSRFLFELDLDIDSEDIEYCPKCRTGILSLRESENGKFKGCSNYPYGCTYTEKLYLDENIE
jgi:DNA helicase-4